MINNHDGFAIERYWSIQVPMLEAVSPVELDSTSPSIAGKVTIDTAKIIGIIPAWFTLIGK